MKKSLLALALLGTAFAAQAADGLTYNYVQGGYVATRADGFKADGWGLDGSVAVHPKVHLFGGFNQQKDDTFDAKVNQGRFGIGYNTAISANTDFVARAAYERAEVPSQTVLGIRVGGQSVDGYSAEAGVRSALANNFEGYALAGYEDGEQVDGNAYGRVGAVAKFTPNWGVTGEVKLAPGGDKQFMIGPRYSW